MRKGSPERKRQAAGLWFALPALAVCLIATCTVAGPARSDEEEDFKPTIIETKTIALGELGDARLTVNIAYKDDSLFKSVSKLVKKYKNFITRHYDRDNTLKVVNNFKQKVDTADKRFILTYDSPGYAYNWGDYWSVGGMGEHKLTKKTASSIEFEYDYHGRGDLTYYNTVKYRLIMKYKAPKGAKNLRFDKTDGRVKYELYPPPPGFFSANRTWLSILFGALALLLAGTLALFVVKTRPGAAAGGAQAAGDAAVSVVVAAPREPSAKVGKKHKGKAEEPPVAVGAGAMGAEAAASPSRPHTIVEGPAAPATEASKEPAGGARVCGSCGKTVPEGKKFCTNCGSPLK